MATEPAVILGTGLVTSLGRGLPAHARALRAGKAHPGQSPVIYAGRQLPFHFATDPAEEGRSFMRIIYEAVSDALAEANLPPAAQSRLAVFVGSTSLDLPLHEAAYAEAHARGTAPVIKVPGYGNLAQDIAGHFALRGPQYTLNTACSSSANAALYARAMIAEGRIDHALIVGAEGYNRLSLLGFASLMLLTREGYRPFDKARDGLILGEGVGAFVLGRAPAEERDSPLRGQSPFSIVGAATACDPSSPTNSLPERVAEVMREALADARLDPAHLVAVKAHGTGTPSNDLSEGQAVRQVFGARLPPLTSVKPYTGHTLGACGAVELLAMLACWREGFLPPTPGFSAIDDALGFAPVTSAVPVGAGAMLCNFFGFGGNNTSVVLAKHLERRA